MKKIVSTLTCLFVLCILVGTNLWILGIRRVSATENGWPGAVLPLESFGPDSATPTGLSPATIRSVYHLPSTGGTGTIAIIDAYDDPTVLNDANVFSTYYGLPNLTSTNFEKHVMGAVSVNGNWSEEISLDVQWAHALAPNAKILLVKATGANASLFDAIDYARSRTDVIAISMSWGTSIEFPEETSYDSHLQPLGNASCCFFAAAGDHCENVSYPACSPNVVGVGGTTLNFVGGSLASETVWYDGVVNGAPQGTGGGVSRYETEPAYQASYGLPGANGHRCVPDVSFDAGSGVSVYDSTPGSAGRYWLDLGGTSLGAPAWAAIYSDGLTASNNILYARAKSTAYNSDFRDITSGSNGLYSATSGYDDVTGLGSPLTTIYDQPPNTPSTPYGYTSGSPGTSYPYTTSTTDPDGDNVCYQFDWGDCSTTTTGYYMSGTIVVASHTWGSSGTYNVKVRAQDSYGAWSSWSSSLTVTISSGGGGGGGCVLYNTRILMADGKEMRVQAVKPGDEIMGYDVQSGAFVTETVTSNEYTVVDEILSINDGLLRVTPTEQPIYTDHGWVKNPQDLVIGWRIYDPMHNSWITIQSIETLKGHFLVYDLRATKPDTFIGNGILLDVKYYME